MGNIPLPALSIKPPEQPDTLTNLSNLLHVKSQLQGQQLQGLQTQEAQINLDNARKQQLEDKTIRDSYRKNAGDLEATIKDAAATGNVSPGTLTKLQETHLKIQTDLATKDEKTLKNALDSGNLFAGALDAVKQVPIENRQQAVQTQLQRLSSQGVDVSSVLKTVQSLPDLSDDTLNGVESSLLGHNKAVEQEMKRREVVAQEQTAQARSTGADNSSKELQAKLPGGALQPIDQREYSDFIAKNPGKGPTDFAKWKASLAPRAQIDVQMSGGGKGGPLTDATVDALAAPGAKLKLSDVLPARAPLQVRQAAINQVQAKYPDFATSAYDIEKGVEKDFTSGGYSQQLNSINRARNHMGTFLKLAQAMDNGDVKIINSASNFFKTQLGSSAPGNLQIAKQAFASEVGKSFAGANVTLHDREELDASIDKASSWTQLSDAAKTADELLAGAQKALKQTHDAGIQGKANFGQESQGGVTVTDPRGVVHTFKDQASADRFKQAAGIK